MRTRLSLLSVIVLVSTLALAACAAPATQPTAMPAATTRPPATEIPQAPPTTIQEASQPKTNAEVVEQLIALTNAGDVEGSMDYFDENAVVYFYGFPPTGFEFYRGKDKIREFWAGLPPNHFQWEGKITSTTGDRLELRVKTWHDFTRQIGIAPTEYIDVYEFKDGKILSYASWITEETMVKFRPVFAEMMAPSSAATQPSDPAASTLTVTIADDTCTTDNPVALQAGDIKVTLNVEDTNNEMYALLLLTLNPGKDVLDLMVATYGNPPPWASILLFKELGPGKSATYTIKAEKGPLYLVCWSKPPDLPIGNAGPFEVLPAEVSAPAPERGENDVMVSFAKKTCTYEGPAFLPKGDLNVIMNLQQQDASRLANSLTFFTLDTGYTLKDLVDSQWMPSPPEWAHMIFMHEAAPGEVTTNSLAVETGPLYYLCWSGSSEDNSPVVGSGGPLEVTP